MIRFNFVWTLTVVGHLIFITILNVGCGINSKIESTSKLSTLSRKWIPSQLDDGWGVLAIQKSGFNICLLDSMAATVQRSEVYENVHAILIAKDDRLVYEQYFTGKDRRWRGAELETVSLTFHRDTLHDIRSIVKSITSALVGSALESGKIPSVYVPLAEYFPEYDTLFTNEKRQITLRSALTMSAGFDWNEDDISNADTSNHAEQMDRNPDPVEFVLARSLVATPDSKWYYNSGLPVLLGMIVSRVTGTTFGTFAREVLFEPLGISKIEWRGPEAWIGLPEFQWKSNEPWARTVSPAGSIWMRPRDLAKFGSLYLNNGRWKGHQVLPSKWVKESTQHHIAVRDSISENGQHGYGYLWWHDSFVIKGREFEVNTAVGNGGQRIFIIPELDLLVVILAGRYNEPDALWMPEQLLLSYILPAACNCSLLEKSPCSESEP